MRTREYLLLPVLVAICFPPSLRGEVAAYVDDIVIQVAEVEGLMDEAEKRFKVAPSMRPRLAARLLERLINDALVRRHLASLVTTRDLESRRRQFESDLAAQEMSWDSWLRENTIDKASLYQQWSWEIGRDRFLSQRLSRSHIEAHFEAHRRQFDGTQLLVAHILLQPTDDESLDILRQRAERIRRDVLQQRYSFAEAARRYSAGATAPAEGELGWIPRHGVMTEAFSSAAFALQPGEMSPAVTTPHGIHIIACRDERKGQLRWADAAEAVRSDLKAKLFAEIASRQREMVTIRYIGTTPYTDPNTGKLILPHRDQR